MPLFLPVASGRTTLFNLKNLAPEHIILKPLNYYCIFMYISVVYTYVCIKRCVEMPEEGVECPPISYSIEAGVLPSLLLA